MPTTEEVRLALLRTAYRLLTINPDRPWPVSDVVGAVAHDLDLDRDRVTDAFLAPEMKADTALVTRAARRTREALVIESVGAAAAASLPIDDTDGETLTDTDNEMYRRWQECRRQASHIRDDVMLPAGLDPLYLWRATVGGTYLAEVIASSVDAACAAVLHEHPELDVDAIAVVAVRP
jgi:hypothetical protein